MKIKKYFSFYREKKSLSQIEASKLSKTKILFSISQDNFMEDVSSENLLKEFVKRGYPTSENAVMFKITNKKWEFDKRYIIKLKNNTFFVYFLGVCKQTISRVESDPDYIPRPFTRRVLAWIVDQPVEKVFVPIKFFPKK